MWDKTYNKAVQKIINAELVVVLTGAGISKESGIPTFRGEDGIWNKLSPDELASYDAFSKNPALVTEWYEHRRQIVQETRPNPAHVVLAELSVILPNLRLITQNIDGLHQRAGHDDVIELHGNIMRNYCIDCRKQYEIDAFEGIYQNKENHHIPRCSCGGLIRPDVVWFGEQLPEKQLERASHLSAYADVFISVGTSAAVRPAGDLPRQAKINGAYLIEINPYQTVISDIADFRMEKSAALALPKLKKSISSLSATKGNIKIGKIFSKIPKKPGN